MTHYAPGHKSPMDSRIQFMLSCMAIILFSHLGVTSFRVYRLRSQDNWWMFNLTSWERLLRIDWFLLYLTWSSLVVGIEGTIRLLIYIYIYIYTHTHAHIPLQLINIMITIIFGWCIQSLLFFVLSLSQLSRFRFLKMPIEKKRTGMIYLL